MFKSNLSSFFVPGWFKKAPVASKDSAEVSNASDIPKNFTIPSSQNKNKLINISMKDSTEGGDTDSFVDIEYRQLTYAEVASMAKDKKSAIVAAKANTPRKERLPINQYNVLNHDEDLDDLNDAYEPFKQDNNKRKTRQTLQLKNRDYELKKKRKEKHKKQELED
ncbi:uncharacterized protein RJT20DRAFT_48534 [Scheffersomyces xylosifermentans]|uniref:uncharacterized protein n=1 Tax=Scheffersomyces xylosifermentans TaxID=1304137 RepID=UPI00315D818C